MLPDLDKPSLKDMGITLMGDMIAILRYAKKVVEETTCERFLVDTEDDHPKIPKATTQARTIVKKASTVRLPNKSTPITKPKLVHETTGITKSSKVSQPTTKSVVVKKKIVPISRPDRDTVQLPPKRKILPVPVSVDISGSESEPEWTSTPPKRLKLPNDEDKVGYTVIMPQGRTLRTQEILKKMTNDQKRTVFDRLGDSSVTSTTNLPEASPTFNITGLGNDVLKRNSSVFNRLGGKDAMKQAEKGPAGILKNGTVNSTAISQPQGILKRRAFSVGSTMISLKTGNKTKVLGNKAVGTMHADHEKNLKSASLSVKQLVRTTKKIRINDPPVIATKKTLKKIVAPASKLGGYFIHFNEKAFFINKLFTVNSHLFHRHLFDTTSYLTGSYFPSPPLVPLVLTRDGNRGNRV